MSEPVQHGLHPDVDSLNAFMEGALPEHERAECLAHLAECAHCREIVYLANESLGGESATREAPVTAAPTAPASFWKRWFSPARALVTASAAVLLVAGAVKVYRFTQPRLSISEMKPPTAATLVAPEPQVQAVSKSKVFEDSVSEQAAPRRSPFHAPTQEPKPENQAPAAAVTRAVAPPPPPPQPAPAVQEFVATAERTPAAQVNSAVPPLPTAAARPSLSGIMGTVSDPAGGVIANAGVRLRLLDSGDTLSATTNDTGRFDVQAAPGRYELQVTAPGFAQSSKQIQVAPQQIAKADTVLSVGSSAESVTVTAGAPVLSTESASLSRAKRAQKVVAAPEIGAYKLPSKLRAAITAAKDKVVLATDSAGALFVSRNAGKSWKAVKGGWTGKVIQIVTPSGSGVNPAFQLTTESGAVWISNDGNHWQPAARQ